MYNVMEVVNDNPNTTGRNKAQGCPRIHMNEKPTCMVLCPTAVRFGEFFIIIAPVMQSHGPDLILTPLSTAALPLAVLISVALKSSLIVARKLASTNPLLNMS